MVRKLWVGLLLFAASGAASSYSSLYFFGDSLSDTGNVFQATSLISAVTLGFIPVQPASPPYYQGRFSNGPVWTELVAQRLGMPDTARPAGMALGGLGSLPGTGNNYAIGGARTGFGGALGPLDSLIPTGLLAQTQFYLSQNGGVADPDALYFVLGGGNDLRDIAAITDPTAQLQSAAQAASYLAYSVFTLYNAGARNFLMANGPDIGFIPESIAAGRIEAGILASQYFNFYLDYYRNVLSAFPGVDIQYFDLFGFYNNIIVDTVAGGPTYGFTSLTPCITPGPGVPSCDQSVFFDSIHPTSRMHDLVGNAVADQIIASTGAVSSRFSDASISAAVHAPEPSTTIGCATVLIFLVVRQARKRKRLPEA
ncbi:MAG: SGNH/GDSL hydrolase family protein [Bryobacteraceae bacterium]|nr:SGNH/GDSL hydrolase family protein [Bryobacteraceae bacterium]